MRRALFATALAALALLGACNDVGECPSKSTIVPGGSCSGDSLECAYDLPSPSPTCDGTDTTIATSCICTNGVWVCPSPLSCASDAAAAGDDGTSSDDASQVGDASGGGDAGSGGAGVGGG